MAGVDIVDLRNNTFYAKLLVEPAEGGEHKILDTRPSAAVALALRAGCPLRVSESVLAEAREDSSQDVLGGDGSEGDEFDVDSDDIELTDEDDAKEEDDAKDEDEGSDEK